MVEFYPVILIRHQDQFGGVMSTVQERKKIFMIVHTAIGTRPTANTMRMCTSPVNHVCLLTIICWSQLPTFASVNVNGIFVLRFGTF